MCIKSVLNSVLLWYDSETVLSEKLKLNQTKSNQTSKIN